MKPINPDDFLNAILAKGLRRDKEEKLRKLHDICQTEYSRKEGMRDLSIANMARIAETHGLFLWRTIYNKASEDYASLIKAWDEYNGPKTKPSAKDDRKQRNKYDWLDAITNDVARNLAQAALVERDKLRVELNLLKSQTVLTIDMRPLGAQIPRGTTNVAVIEASAQLTDSEQKALRAAIDPKMLAQRKWRIGETGEVLDERDRFVFNPGFATGIQKTLGVNRDA
jgi:hypothetical protein